ncbi:hypothetical protein EYC84_002098 [Monilinia fructicola]|uniref:Zn(2)-C6 fungal-type domain-containing protein n=1 Tax=Monilinia fructicola TaxID=38448 RepID=A0A5M9JVP6_MONFR|nr:hypothetical protein EYC84_002098 [Monilinia fructicola]
MRNARACEACRASKNRCFFVDDHTICQRCEQTKGQCIVREKARPRRARGAKRARRLELTKAEDSPLSSNTSISTDNPLKDGEFSLDLPTTVYHDPAKDAELLQDHHRRIFKDDNSRSPTPPKEILHSPPKYISRRKLTLSQATHLLNSYIPKLPFFPFVTLPANPTIPALSQQSPFLLLAVLTIAAIPHPLVSDLGLDQGGPQTNPFREFDVKGLLDSNGNWTTEAKRAYMGCYVLGSHLSKLFNKPQTMSYENLLPSNGDSFIPSTTGTPATAIVMLERISDRINNTWTANNYPQMDTLSTELYIQVFTAELETWKRNVPESLTASPLLAIYHKFTHLSVYSHALRLLKRPYKPFAPGTRDAIPSPDHLHTCLRLGASYLQSLLSLPTTEYTHFNIIHWSQLVHCLVALVRLTFVIAHVENWSAEMTRERVGLGMYLEALCFRLSSLSSNSQLSTSGDLESSSGEKLDASSQKGRRKHLDKYFIMHSMMSTLRKTWEKRVEAIVPKASTISKGKCPMFDPEMAPLLENASLDFDFGDMEAWGDDLGEAMTEWNNSMQEVGTGGTFPVANIETPGDGEGGLPVMSGGNATIGEGEMSGVGQHGSGEMTYNDLWATMTCSWAEQPPAWPGLDLEGVNIRGNGGVFGYQVNEE